LPAEALQAALADGEDYELLLALAADDAHRLCQNPPCPVALTRIGRVVEGGDVIRIGPDGRRASLPPCGWEHTT
jgi:thiamine monophosphate kinase